MEVHLHPALRRSILNAAFDAEVSIGEWLRQAALEKLEREDA